MAKYSVPGIRFTEIDNSLRTEALPGMGIGAIVMKSNKGPVNQRVVTSNYNEFTEVFGEPESLTDYGHFAAENYFANSTQLFAVRATMGDEQYSQIQYSYNGAPITATNKSDDTAKFVYVDKEGDNNLRLVSQLATITNYNSLVDSGEWSSIDDDDTISAFGVRQKGFYGDFNDIISETSDRIVFKGKNVPDGTSESEAWTGTIVKTGMHVVYPYSVDISGHDAQLYTKLMFSDEGWESSASPADIKVKKKSTMAGDMYNVTVSVPESATLDSKKINISFYGNLSAVSGWETSGVNYKDIFNNDVFYGDFDGSWEDPETDGYGYVPAQKMEIMDWDDTEIKKTYYVDSDNFKESCKPAQGIKFTEYFSVDPTYAIIGGDLDPETAGDQRYLIDTVSGMYLNKFNGQQWTEGMEKFKILDTGETGPRTPKEAINDVMDDYSCNDISDINEYYFIMYYDVFTDRVIQKVIKESPEQMKDSQHNEDYLFWLFSEKGSDKLTKESVYIADDPELVSLPLQSNFKYDEKDSDDQVVKTTLMNNIIANPTSYIFNSVDKTYADGYTLKTESEDEPGNGDIERYRSNFDDQLVIASIGPGEYGDDIGVSIITTECADIPALQHQNAFNWKYSYDDEDLVDKDTSPYNSNPYNLTWKKVFRINVYVKNKSQTAEAAWGFGMDALKKDPAESWFVSTDPYAKDGEGNSLYAPNVINGHSEYIYVSRSSVSDASDNHGEYQQPAQTYAIYGLTGGKNSTKNNISEKTAALNLYKDRQRARFDILFNVDAVDSFNGRQRFTAHQRKIAEIAASRTMDIGVVQVTSKIAKTAKQMLSESKVFSFNNGSYVAEYGGYDKYYNSALASWIYLPKSVAGACAMAYCDTFARPWQAPAGVDRGTISYTAGQLLKLTDDEIGLLYDNNVNTTRDCGSYGVVLWGQKTALKKNSLLNRINVRRCLNYIEKRLENMMTPYLFMQNSVNTRSAARNDIDSFLSRVKAGQGIDSFDLSVTADPEDPTIMNVAIQIWPTPAIEFIDVKITINRTRGIEVVEG